ncbi:hypothetical protein ACFSDD_09115 [Salipiger marinus]|uniref:hypothetical protein n=1 Tax=Salipiger marinus TaxID=555512 RepID=UPI002C2C5F01|nr:hypothetical protein [Salipiger manganoxidans]MEB3421902.1 hypothetical protein [Salipiger manganoxidans]
MRTPLGRAALGATLALILFALTAAAALAQQTVTCAAQDQVIDQLDDLYGERLRATGLAGPTGLMQLFSAETGTWTILLVTPEGMACLLASGTDFEAVITPTGEPA